MIERIEIQRTATAELRAEALAGTVNFSLEKTARRRSHDLKLNLRSARGELAPSATWQLSNRRGDLSDVLDGTPGRHNFRVTENERHISRDPAGNLSSVRNGDFRVNGDIDTLSMSPSLDLHMDNGDTVPVPGFLHTAQLRNYGDTGYAMESGAPVRSTLAADYQGQHRLDPRRQLHLQEQRLLPPQPAPGRKQRPAPRLRAVGSVGDGPVPQAASPHWPPAAPGHRPGHGVLRGHRLDGDHPPPRVAVGLPRHPPERAIARDADRASR